MISNIEVRLWGNASYDIADDVVSISINRGKSRQLDYYDPSTASIVLNNHSRKFDPTNTSSPYNGLIVPKKRIEIWYDSTILFSGLIDAWFFSYDVNGNSIATVNLTDFTGILSSQYLATQTFPAELSGSRINRILNDSNVAWSTAYGDRVIDAGVQWLDSQTIDNNTNVLEYLRSVEDSEQGQIFSYGNSGIKFEDSSRGLTSTTGYELFADDGSTNTSFGSAKASVRYTNIEVIYDSSLMYNKITTSSFDELTNGTANVLDSQADYSINELNVQNVLYNGVEKVQNLANHLAGKYGYPEYRFNSLTINPLSMGTAYNYDFISNTQLNDFAKVKFTPNSVGSAIERFVRIIGIQHSIDANNWVINYSFESNRVQYFILDDTTFGKLDSTYVLSL